MKDLTLRDWLSLTGLVTTFLGVMGAGIWFIAYVTINTILIAH